VVKTNTLNTLMGVFVWQLWRLGRRTSTTPQIAELFKLASWRCKVHFLVSWKV